MICNVDCVIEHLEVVLLFCTDLLHPPYEAFSLLWSELEAFHFTIVCFLFELLNHISVLCKVFETPMSLSYSLVDQLFLSLCKLVALLNGFWFSAHVICWLVLVLFASKIISCCNAFLSNTLNNLCAGAPSGWRVFSTSTRRLFLWTKEFLLFLLELF